MHAIGHIELGNYEKAAQDLNRSFALYVKEPFNVSKIKLNNSKVKNKNEIVARMFFYSLFVRKKG